MASTTGYTRLPKSTRDDVRCAARKQAERAAERYAQLLAAEAGIAARVPFPALSRLVFRLTDDLAGPAATLVAAYTTAGRQLWNWNTGPEWPDESLVTDLLAAAADWSDGHFETVDANDLNNIADVGAIVDAPAPDGAELYVLTLDT